MRTEQKIFKLPLPMGGLNNTDDETTLVPNILVDVLNFEPEKNGMKTRPGYSEYSVSGLPTDEPEEGLYNYSKSDGNSYLMVYCDTDLYVEGATVGVFSSIKSSLTAGNPWNFTTLANLAIACNGVDPPIKYNGTTAYTLAIDPPSSGPSAVTGAAGVLTGSYKYKVSFVSESGSETNPGAASASVSPSSELVDLSSIPTGTGEVISRKIYRTEAGGSIFYYLDTLPDNTATTYEDNTADVNLGTDIAPTAYTSPPAEGNFPIVYKEYLFMVDPNFPTRIYFSYQSTPEIFDTTEGTGYYLIVGLNDGENIIGIRPLRGALYVFKEYSVWPVLGDTPDGLRVTPQALSSVIGLYHRSMDYVDMGRGDVLVGLSKNGLYAFDGYAYKNIGFQPDVNINITAFLNTLDKNQYNWAYGFNDVIRNQYRCSVRRAGYSYNDREIVWDYNLNRITIFDIKSNATIRWNNATLFCSSQSDGKVHSIGGFNDDGSAITQRLRFPWWAFGDDFKVDFDRLNLDVTLEGNYSATVTAQVDWHTNTYTLALANSASWGGVSWVTSAGYFRAKVPFNIVGTDGVWLKGQALRLQIDHSVLNQPLTVNSVTVYYSESDEYSGIDPEQSAEQAMGT